MNIGLWLQEQARFAPERPALFLGSMEVANYGAFHDRSARLACAMRHIGIKPGDRVAIFMQNRPDYLICLHAIWYAGAVAVPINAKLHAREAVYIIWKSGASLVFATKELGAQLSDADLRVPISCPDEAGFASLLDHTPIAAPEPRAPTDLAWLFFTSGTTGKPKGVMITHGMLMSMSLCYMADVDQVRGSDATLYAAPMSHGAGLYSLVHVRAGARHVCPKSGGFDAQEVLDLAEDHENVHLFAAPTMVKRLTAFARHAGRRGTGLRTIVYAGGPMYQADILDAVEWFGPLFVQIYGQGECPMGITALSRADVADRNHPDWRERLGSVGRAQSAVEVAIGDADGRVLPPGAFGEIMVRGATVMPGYWQAPDATRKTLLRGWLMTGDMGVMDRAGYVTLRDRSKDLIISGGSNIYPREVEEVLLTHPGVREASVIGAPHPEWGEEVVAFVVGDASEQELDALCRDQIARFKRPKRYEFVESLPKNNYGKVLKTELRDRFKA